MANITIKRNIKRPRVVENQRRIQAPVFLNRAPRHLEQWEQEALNFLRRQVNRQRSRR
jgi:hypothetical protein